MKSRNLNSLIERFVYTFLLLTGYTAFAQGRPGTVFNPGGNGGATAEGAVPRDTPIDMYEGVLLMVAVVMMVGYYLYTRNRKAIA